MTTIKLLSSDRDRHGHNVRRGSREFRGRAARHNTRAALLYGHFRPRRPLDYLGGHSNMVRSVGPGRARPHLRRCRQWKDMLRCGGSEARRVIAVSGALIMHSRAKAACLHDAATAEATER